MSLSLGLHPEPHLPPSLLPLAAFSSRCGHGLHLHRLALTPPHPLHCRDLLAFPLGNISHFGFQTLLETLRTQRPPSLLSILLLPPGFPASLASCPSLGPNWSVPKWPPREHLPSVATVDTIVPALSLSSSLPWSTCAESPHRWLHPLAMTRWEGLRFTA